MSKIKKFNFVFISIVLAVICGLAYCLPTFINAKNVTTTANITRTIEVKQNEIDCQSIFEMFDSSSLESNENITTFEGVKTFNFADFDELDLVSETDVVDAEMKVKYNYAYDSETNFITLTATLIGDDGTETIDTMVGIAFVNDSGNLDALFDCDGEFILLSELQDSGLIQNCGWFKKAFKKVASAVKKVTQTTIGKIGAIATIAIPAVIGVVAAVVAAPILPVIAIGAVVGAGIAVGTAMASTYVQDGKIDWGCVGMCAGVGAAVGAISSAVAYKITTAIKSLFPKAKPSANVKSFDTYNGFKKEYGKASDYINNGEWHHIVEQQSVTKGINSGASVYNSQNTVAVSRNLHQQVSSYYSSRYGIYSSFRDYVNTLSYEQQYIKGLEILKMFAERLGETIIWL